MPCLIRKPCTRAFIRRAAIGGPHGGTRGPQGIVEPVAPVAPEPGVPGFAHRHGIGKQFGAVPEAFNGQGGGGQELVDPVDPVEPELAVEPELVPHHAHGIGWQSGAVCGGHGGGVQELVGPVDPVEPVAGPPMTGHGHPAASSPDPFQRIGGHFGGQSHGMPDDPVVPVAPVGGHGGQNHCAMPADPPVAPVVPVASIIGHGGGHAHIAGIGVAPVVPVAPVGGHFGGQIHGSRTGWPGAPVPPLETDAPAITHGGTQNHGFAVDPVVPVAPVGGQCGRHHGRRAGIIVTPVWPVAPPDEHGTGTGHPLVAPVEPVAPGLKQCTHSATDRPAAARQGGNMHPVGPVAPDEPVAPVMAPHVITHFAPLWRWCRSV
jgi:hypothetical protein